MLVRFPSGCAAAKFSAQKHALFFASFLRRRAFTTASRASTSDQRKMADEIEATVDHEMTNTQQEEKEDEKPSTDIEELKKSVAEDSTTVEEADGKTAAEPEEEEEYVLKDEAHEEEDNQKDG